VLSLEHEGLRIPRACGKQSHCAPPALSSDLYGCRVRGLKLVVSRVFLKQSGENNNETLFLQKDSTRQN